MSQTEHLSHKSGVSLLIKAILIVLLTSTLCLSLFGWYRHSEVADQLKKKLENSTTLTVERLEIALEAFMYDFDDEGIKAVIEAEMKSPLIAAVFIMNGELVQFGYARDKDGQIVSSYKLPVDQDYLSALGKIKTKDTELGDVKVFVTLSYLAKDLRSSLFSIAAQVVILDIILVLALTLFIQTIILKPLDKLVYFIKKVSQGAFTDTDDHQSFIAMAGRGDEIGGIAQATLQMRNSILAVLDETDKLIKTIQEGRFTIRGDVEKFEGGWRELIAGINNVIDAITQPVNTTGALLTRLAKGDIPDAITDDYQGDFNKIKKNLNALIAATDEVTRIAEEVGGGNMSVDARERSSNDRQMRALNAMIAGLRGTVSVAGKIAEGDLTVQADILSEKDTLGKSLNEMIKNLIRFGLNVQKASIQLAAGSEQVSGAASQISHGTSQQAAGIEEISASMEEMSSTIGLNADNAQQTAQISSKTAQLAQEGGKAVTETVQAMKSITEKIKIIEDIAHQTNLLALNASIEAARAQKHGMGFAVVASEVGKLSKRTQEAAKVINDLSITNTEIAEKAGGLIGEVVTGIQQTADLVQEISISSNEQSGGIEQVNQAIQQLDQIIQENVATTEQMASNSEDYNMLAENLIKSVSFFSLPDTIEPDKHATDDALKKLEQAFIDKQIPDMAALIGFLKIMQDEKDGSENDFRQLNQPQLEATVTNASDSTTTPNKKENADGVDVELEKLKSDAHIPIDATDADFEQY